MQIIKIQFYAQIIDESFRISSLSRRTLVSFDSLASLDRILNKRDSYVHLNRCRISDITQELPFNKYYFIYRTLLVDHIHTL